MQFPQVVVVVEYCHRLHMMAKAHGFNIQEKMAVVAVAHLITQQNMGHQYSCK